MCFPAGPRLLETPDKSDKEVDIMIRMKSSSAVLAIFVLFLLLPVIGAWTRDRVQDAERRHGKAAAVHERSRADEARPSVRAGGKGRDAPNVPQGGRNVGKPSGAAAARDGTGGGATREAPGNLAVSVATGASEVDVVMPDGLAFWRPPANGAEAESPVPVSVGEAGGERGKNLTPPFVLAPFLMAAQPPEDIECVAVAAGILVCRSRQLNTMCLVKPLKSVSVCMKWREGEGATDTPRTPQMRTGKMELF